ncbi:hypothetical protein B0H16DRAFT_1896953 [Mycena metata]|uniref:F-box domain-containing protein n=1 Tax=Mycena metata TaxID=1033252 RepID=A0AAD7HG62_9AGAR|nr:hypothetical protein B0H16DRAFT_1896953 [Mycena metata]
MSTTTTCANCGFNDPPPATHPPHGSLKWRDFTRARLASTRQQISALQARLEILDEERQELERKLETFTYPVSSTPVELVTEIFLACLPANGRVQPSSRAAPLSLAQICRHWREIALSTPRLWSSVDLTFQRGISTGGWFNRRIRTIAYYSDEGDSDEEGSDDMGSRTQRNIQPSDPDSPYDGACALLRTWFHRAKGCPVSITLRCSSDRRAMPPKIFPAIAEFRGQWGRLELVLPFDDLQALDSINGPFPALQTLSIDLAPPRRGFHTPKLTTFQAAPQLRTLRLFRNLSFKDVRLAAPQLTALHLPDRVHFSKEEWIGIFTRFPALRHFTASLSFDFEDEDDPSPFTNVPPLESLIVDPSADPLGVLTLPYLRHLQCYLAFNRVAVFMAFLSRSACILTHLSIRTYEVRDDTLIQCLRAVPHLITFELKRHASNDGLYEELRSPGLLPHLQHLSIEENGEEYNYEPVFTMLRMRRAPYPEPAARLRTFDLQLDVSEVLSDDESAAPVGPIAVQLQRFAADGLRARVRTDSHKWTVSGDDDEEKDFP